MRLRLHEFFTELDERWVPRGTQRVSLRLIGSTALFLQTDYVRGTKDSDVLETDEVDEDTRVQLESLAGAKTALHTRHDFYLDIVRRTVPLLPPEPLWHRYDLGLKNFEILVLDIADVVVSKLKRWNARDQEDVRAMVERGHVDHQRVLARLREVIERYKLDGRADVLSLMAERFNRVERDWFVVPETPFDFPEETFR